MKRLYDWLLLVQSYIKMTKKQKNKRNNFSFSLDASKLFKSDGLNGGYSANQTGWYQ